MDTKPLNYLSMHAAYDLLELFTVVGFNPVDLTMHTGTPELSVYLDLKKLDRKEVTEFFDYVVKERQAYKYVEEVDVNTLDDVNIKVIHYTFKS